MTLLGTDLHKASTRSTRPWRRLVLAAVVAVLGVFALGACSSSGGSVQTVGPDEFRAAVDEGADIIDVRTPAEFAEGHIEGATNIDLNGGNFEAAIGQLDSSKTYAVYCRSGNRSATATGIMADNGFSNLYDLDGGVLAWQSTGLPLA